MAFYNQNCLYFWFKAVPSHESRCFSFQATKILAPSNFVDLDSSLQVKTPRSYAIKPALDVCYNDLGSDTF